MNSISLIQKAYVTYITNCSFQRKKIFELLQWYGQNCISIFPSQQTIANQCKCSRKTVSEAIRELLKFGFIQKIRRPYRSNLYRIHHQLLWQNVKHLSALFKIEISERKERLRKMTINACKRAKQIGKKIFDKVTRGVTRGVTVIYKNKDVERSKASPCSVDHSKLDMEYERLKVPSHWNLKKMGIKLNFLDVFGFEIVSKAINEMKTDKINGDYLTVLSEKCKST